ncbi:hypothetical protein NQ318_004922 [Aromia moschata]|uniref:F-box domain-containing protein n=1 Tax=Aromia moschata TaxID=1265417 RepID=A0AAV8Z0K6_9CUCU|nr:hypothetical protein NQ318_004922 [Aromia moschata]
MLEDAVVELQMATDIEWFRLLSDVNQVVLIISLLRLGGGYTRRLVSMPLTLEYFRRIRALPPSLPAPSSPNKKVHIKGSEIETDEEDNEENEENCYDPNHPSTIEVEKQRKKWNDITAKYKREVESLEKKISNKNEEEKKKGGLGKKGGKSKTSQKSSKKGKGKKVQDEVDRIQSLPVWIIKKILGYLDQKNLKKLKVVNSYWTYIIQDLIIDIKMRKKLDKTIEKIKSQIDPAKLEEAVTKKVIDEKQTKIKKSRRAKAHYECSVTAKELIPRELIGLTEKSLNVDVHNEIYAEEDYRKEDDKPLLTFPRVIKDDKLYDYVPCPLRDVKVVLGLQDGTERHISFLTYSLSSRQSSIEFDVQAEDLRDW